jgi:hypothetical protein
MKADPTMDYETNPIDGMTVVLEDRGQDFLEFDIRGGRIVASRPFQRWLWVGVEVTNQSLSIGKFISYRRDDYSGVKTIKYPIIAVSPLKEAKDGYSN